MTYIQKCVQILSVYRLWQNKCTLVDQDPNQEIEYNQQYKIPLKALPAIVFYCLQITRIYTYITIVFSAFEHYVNDRTCMSWVTFINFEFYVSSTNSLTSLLYSIPLYKYTIAYLFILLLMDIQSSFSLGLFQTGLI